MKTDVKSSELGIPKFPFELEGGLVHDLFHLSHVLFRLFLLLLLFRVLGLFPRPTPTPIPFVVGILRDLQDDDILACDLAVTNRAQ